MSGAATRAGRRNAGADVDGMGVATDEGTATGRAAALRSEALALLAGAGIPDLLERRFGAFALVGSAALDLMSWRDIDLYVPAERGERARFVALIHPLLRALEGAGCTMFRATFNDEWAVPRGTYGSGYYWGLRVRTAADAVWKIDLWGWDAQRYARKLEDHGALNAALRDADRDLILKLKEEAQVLPGFRDTITSHDIYRFVLAGAGENIDQLRAFAAANR